MKKILLAIIAGLLIISHANALQQIAGELVISVPRGGSGSASYGLINDEEETITIGLRAEGDVADYLSFPETVELLPNKIVYTDITANIPEDYDLSLGKNITGFVYALQEGEPGQVKINVQMKKSVVISVSEEVVEETTTVEEETTEGTQPSPITGLIALVSTNYGLIAIIVVLLVVLFMLIKIKGRR